MLSFKDFVKIIKNTKLYDIELYLCSRKEILLELDYNKKLEIKKSKIIKNEKTYNTVMLKGYKKRIDEIFKITKNVLDKIDKFTKIKIIIKEVKDN